MNTEYVEARNLLIPHAERYADKEVGKKLWKNKREQDLEWNLVYLAEMDRLVKFTRLTEGGKGDG